MFRFFTPFFVLSTFLSLTNSFSENEKKKTAVKVTIAVMIISIVLYFAGNQIFEVFGITLNSFRIGTGALLFLSAVNLIQDKGQETDKPQRHDVAVVPLAIPVTVGPATTGTLLVMGVETQGFLQNLLGILAVCLAVITVGILLYLSGRIEKMLKKQGLSILSKLTGLILAAISAQMIMMGVLGFLK
ncbi:MAG: MarC family protein [Bacteroidales bacterium]|nr:MarC family protein [Bacteroidales bacterium]